MFVAALGIDGGAFRLGNESFAPCSGAGEACAPRAMILTHRPPTAGLAGERRRAASPWRSPEPLAALDRGADQAQRLDHAVNGLRRDHPELSAAESCACSGRRPQG